MGLGIFPKAHKLLDLIAGVATGVYRVSMSASDKPRNTNDHYHIGIAAGAARVASALTDPMLSTIYPAMFWADRFLRGIETPHICDFGGGYGEACTLFGRVFPNARFTVVEVPEIVEQASAIDAAKHIHFTDTPPASCDLLFSSGVTMQAHGPQFACIEQLKPKAVIISAVEITPGDTFWSMQINRRYGRRCPYITFSEKEFVDRILAFGYILLDTWRMGQAMSGPSWTDARSRNFVGLPSSIPVSRTCKGQRRGGWSATSWGVKATEAQFETTKKGTEVHSNRGLSLSGGGF